MAFKKAYMKPILEGRKTTTLRLGTSLQDGDHVAFTCHRGEPPFAYATVKKVSFISTDEFDEDLAKSEGFSSVETLKAVLEKLYPGEQQFVRIEFVPHSVA